MDRYLFVKVTDGRGCFDDEENLKESCDDTDQYAMVIKAIAQGRRQIAARLAEHSMAEGVSASTNGAA